MVDIKDIKKKDDAVADTTLYNSRKLTSAEKAIFDHDDIKGDLTKIRDTAEVLEDVIKAKEESIKNTVLLNKLRGYKTSKPHSVKAINDKNSSQFDSAITSLEKFEGTSDDEATLQAEYDNLETQEKALRLKIKQNGDKRGLISIDAAKTEAEYKRLNELADQLDTTFRSHLTGIGLKTDAAGNVTNRFNTSAAGNLAATDGYFLSDGTTRVNQKLLDVVAKYNNASASTRDLLFDAEIRYKVPHRRSVVSASLRSAAFETFDMMRGDDFKTALFKYVDSSLSASSIHSSLGGKAGLKKAWERLLVCDWEKFEVGDMFVYWEDSRKDGTLKYNVKDRANNKDIIAKWPSDTSNYTDNEKCTYPFVTFNMVQFLHIMNAVFPNGTLKSNPLLDKSTSYALPNSFLDKEDRKITFSVGACVKEPAKLKQTSSKPDQHINFLGWIKKHEPDQLQFFKAFETPETDFRGILQFFWDGGFNDAIKTHSSGKTKWEYMTEIVGYEVEVKVLKDIIEWAQAVKKEARDKDGIEVEEELLEDISTETVREMRYLLKKKGFAGQAGNAISLISQKSMGRDYIKLDLSITPPPSIPTTTPIYNTYKRYISLDPLDQKVSSLRRDALQQNAMLVAYNTHLSKLAEKYAEDQMELTEIEARKKILKDALDDKKVKDLPTLKSRFTTLYGDGPPPSGTTKYLPEEIIRLSSLFTEIGKLWESKAPTPNDLEVVSDFGYKLDPTYKGYFEKIKQLKDELTSWQSKKDYYQESGEDGKERAKKCTAEQLREFAEVYSKIDGLRKLTVGEKKQWEDVKKGKSIEDDGTPPLSDLDAAKLNTIFGTTGLDASTIYESGWKATKNFNTETNLKKLIDPYKGTSEGVALVEHLKHENWGGTWGGVKFEGEWVDFVKKGPEFIIGAIKHYEWEHGKGEFVGKPKDPSIITEMNNANNKEKAKELKVTVEKEWDTTKAAHIAQFLYKRAEGESGKELIKEYKEIKDEIPEDKEDQPTKNHWEKYWYWYVGGGLVVAAVIGVVVYFWDSISKTLGWSKDEDSEKDEENE